MTRRRLRCFFDTDVLLDVVLRRPEFVDHSAHTLLLAEQRVVDGYTSALVMANVFYIAGRALDIPAAHAALRNIRLILDLLPIGAHEVDRAFQRYERHPDWEDQLQYAAAEYAGLEYLLTRNVGDFPSAPVRPMSPVDLLMHPDLLAGG